jgi:hypothetical protein
VAVDVGAEVVAVVVLGNVLVVVDVDGVSSRPHHRHYENPDLSGISWLAGAVMSASPATGGTNA